MLERICRQCGKKLAIGEGFQGRFCSPICNEKYWKQVYKVEAKARDIEIGRTRCLRK